MGRISPQAAAKARANGKKGGRPKGKKTKVVLDREAALKHYRERVTGVTDLIFEKQLSRVRGLQILYRIDKEFVKTGHNKDGSPKGWYRPKKPVIVEDKEEISDFLEGEFDNPADDGASYYYMTVKEPDNHTMEGMLDRTHGRAKQGDLDVHHRVAKPLLEGLDDPKPAKKDVQANDSAKKSKKAK